MSNETERFYDLEATDIKTGEYVYVHYNIDHKEMLRVFNMHISDSSLKVQVCETRTKSEKQILAELNKHLYEIEETMNETSKLLLK